MEKSKLDTDILEYKRLWRTRGGILEMRDSLAALAFSELGVLRCGSVEAAMELLLSLVKDANTEQEALNAAIKTFYHNKKCKD